jgi:hypothetical protein
MSATNRSDVRDELDRYDTPEWCVRRLLDVDPLFSHPRDGGRWLEPSAGCGAIVHAVDVWRNGADLLFPHWTQLDIAPRREGIVATDFLSARFSSGFDVIIGNPPYRLAEDFARRCVGLADTTALLLRLNWLASAKRAPWLQEHTPSVYVLPNRPSFSANGKTDATDYAWFVWRRNDRSSPEVRILATTPASERRGQ